jgi:hypothetical protein
MQSKQSTQDLVLDPALQQSESSSQGSQEHSQENAPSISRRSQQEASLFVPAAEDDILKDYDIAVERAQTWTMTARFGFNAMLASPEYKNKLRLKPDKLERILHFLMVPEAKSRERDRADAQAKHQAQNWLYQGGILYRKESRLQHPRRHVAANEVFDILTAEHLKSGHHGRDKMLKVLEAKYIGYTKDELMYVLDHCLTCSSKHIRGAAARRKELKQGSDFVPQYGSRNGVGVNR